jgi:hypothetical protein
MENMSREQAIIITDFTSVNMMDFQLHRFLRPEQGTRFLKARPIDELGINIFS